MNAHEVAIIAIGSELLAGQITNRNAAWLSSHLFDLGFSVRLHLTVDDRQDDIVWAMQEAGQTAATLLLTGGLGPTSDDLTRNAVARFVGRDLEFDAKSWQHIESQFSRLGLTPPLANRQQCFFPHGATVLTNHAGTANGFKVNTDQHTIYVLPGPPREIERLWSDHLHQDLQRHIPAEQRKRLKMWRTIGRGESHIAEIVEPLVAQSGAEIAYRAHPPYIETKLRYPAELALQLAPVFASLDTKLAPWLYERDSENHLEAFLAAIKNCSSLNIYDGATQGHLQEQLGPRLRELQPDAGNFSFVTSWENHDSPELFLGNCLQGHDDVILSLGIAGFDERGQWAVGLYSQSTGLRLMTRPAPYSNTAMRPRGRMAMAALALPLWTSMLAGQASSSKKFDA